GLTGAGTGFGDLIGRSLGRRAPPLAAHLRGPGGRPQRGGLVAFGARAQFFAGPVPEIIGLRVRRGWSRGLGRRSGLPCRRWRRPGRGGVRSIVGLLARPPRTRPLLPGALGVRPPSRRRRLPALIGLLARPPRTRPLLPGALGVRPPSRRRR